MHLRPRSALDLPVLHYLSYAPYRSIFISTLAQFEFHSTRISLHGARGGAAFLAHRKGQQADQLALIRRWRSAASVAHYLENAKASLASLQLGNHTHQKVWHAETDFFNYPADLRASVERYYTHIPPPNHQPSPAHATTATPAPTRSTSSTPYHPTQATFPSSLPTSRIASPQPQTTQPATIAQSDSDSDIVDLDNPSAPFSAPYVNATTALPDITSPACTSATGHNSPADT